LGRDMDRWTTDKNVLGLGPSDHRETDPWLPKRRPKVLGMVRWLRHRFHREDGTIELIVSRDFTEIELTVKTPYYRANIELRTWGVGELWEGSIMLVDYEQEIGNTHPWDHVMGFCDGCPHDTEEGCTYQGPEGCLYLKELYETLDQIDATEGTDLGKIKVSPAYGEERCHLQYGGVHYFAGAYIEFNGLDRAELKALIILMWALTGRYRSVDP